MPKTDQEIEYLIRARYPLIYVISWEEERVEKCLKQIAHDPKRNRKVFLWSITRGMTDERNESFGDSRDPQKALDFIMQSNENALFVLRDFHPYLQDHAVVRGLRDFCRIMKDKEVRQTILLVSPQLFLPPELEKEIAVVDYDLPDQDELANIFETILKTLPADRRAKVDQELTDSKKELILKAALGLTYDEALNVFSKSLIKKEYFDIEEILAEKKQIIRKSQVLEFFQPRESFADVGGLVWLKTWLSKRGKAFTDEARRFGLPMPRGILMIGVPGCGKSLVAKAVGARWQKPLLRLDVGKVFAGLVGSSEENMRSAIRTAESIAPAILWVDELEKGFSGMQSSAFSDAGTTARVFGSFVTWMQEKTKPVFVIATANNVTLLPPELLRKGRFDEIFFVDLPQSGERKEIFKIHIEKRNRDPENFDLERLANAAHDFSGSEIEQAVISALYDAFDKNGELSTDGILASLAETIPLSKTMREEIEHLREWARGRARYASPLEQKEKDTVGRPLEI